MMERFKRDWPKMYANDPDLSPFWKSKGNDRWGYWHQDGLLWKAGMTGAQVVCVPTEADKGEIMKEI